jgi:hypothetical protein
MSSIETTLSSPLLRAPYEQFFDALLNPSSLKTETARLANSYRNLVTAPPVLDLVAHTTEMNPELFLLGESEPSLKDSSYSSLHSTLSFVSAYCRSLEKGLGGQLGDTTGFARLQLSDSSILTEDVILAYQRALFWINVIEGNVSASSRGSWFKVGEVICSRRFTVVSCPKHGPVVLTHDAALMFKDATYSHFLIKLYARINYEKSWLSALLGDFLEWGNIVLSQLGDAGYGIIKGVEPLTVVQMVHVSENWLDSGQQCIDMVDKYIKKEIDAGGTGLLTQGLWARISSLISLEQIAEYFGFMKLLGHPYVDPREGVEKVKKLIFNPAPKKFEACERLGFSVCHLYTRGYIEKKGKWPPLEFSRGPCDPPSQLELLYNNNQPSLAPGFTQYNATDWRTTTFVPHLEFEMGEDILSLLSDKALSYKRDEFDAVWYGKLPYKPPRPTSSKRALTDFLTRPTFNLREITTQVMDRTLPRENYICSQSPKEREMKWDAPRMFVKFTGPVRAFFNNIEKNAKKGPFQYFKEQTMTMNRQELLQRFLQTTTPRDGRWVDLHIGIDFSSWNLCWDNENHSTPTGTRFDEWFGTPGVHTFCHEFFSESISVLDNSDYPPRGLSAETRTQVLAGALNLDTVYTGHTKGYEGIQQAEWTASTLGLTHMAVSPLGLPFIQSGQGDNQVFTFHLYIPPGSTDREIQQYIRDICAQILERLNATAAELGHEIKPEECVCSTSFFSYGKEMYVNGTYYCSTSKHISRIFPTTTADTPSTYEYISSVGSGGIASTDKSNNSLPHLVLTKFIEHLTVSRELRKSLLHGDKLGEVLAKCVGPEPLFHSVIRDLLCIIPSNVGGLPISSPLEYLYRGHSDPLGSSIVSLLLLNTFPGVSEYVQVLTRDWIYNSEPSLVGLILDPYSLPLTGVSPPSLRVAREVLPVLYRETKNDLVTPILQQSTPTDRENLFSWLSTTKPFYPKIAHDIYKGSPVGLLDTFCRRFTNTRTLVQLTTNTGSNLRRVSVDTDLTYITAAMRRLCLVFKIGSPKDQHPTLQVADFSLFRYLTQLRGRWKVGELEGITNLHPLYAGVFYLLPSDHTKIQMDREIVVMSEYSNSDIAEKTRGPVTPYLGSRTSDKTVGKWIKPLDSSPPLQEVIKLLTIQSMTATEGSDFWTAIDSVAQSRCSIPLDIMREFCRIKIGGTLAHRWITRDDAQGSFVNISTNWPSHLTVSTNHAGALGLTDYPFDFQEAITLIQGLISWWNWSFSRPPPFGIVLNVDLNLMEPLSDHVIQSSSYTGSQVQVADSYYSKVTQIRVSSRATKAALLRADVPLNGLQTIEGEVSDALRQIIFLHLGGDLPMGAKYGKSLGQISYKRIIDMPELSILTTAQFRQALAEAIYLRVALPAALLANKSSRKLDEILPSLLSTEIRRSLPTLYGTIKELDAGRMRGSDGLGLGYAGSPRALTRWMSATYLATLHISYRIPTTVYTRGPSSVSRTLSSSLGTECILLLRGATPLSWKAGKELARLLQIVNQGEDEVTKVRQLVTLIQEIGLGPLYSKAHTSSLEVLRTLRGQIMPLTHEVLDFTRYSCLPRWRYSLPHTPLDQPIQYRENFIPFPYQVASWERREILSYEPGVIWSPLATIYRQPNLRILLVGLGDGFISYGLPTSWIVTGLELGRVLASQAHSMVNYHPPHMAQSFILHPASWTLGGDILDDRVTREIHAEIKLGVYDLVLLDIDGVSPGKRLLVRSQLASSGTPVYCKVLVSPSDLLQLKSSFLAYRSVNDHAWVSRAYPDREMVLGGSSSPLGLLASVESYSNQIEEIEFPAITHLNLRVQNEPPYCWEDDALIVTGDFPAPHLQFLTLRSLRSLRSYLSPLSMVNLDLFIELLERGCPKSRVKAAYRLFRSGHLR